PASRGGSKWMHELARVGAEIEVCGPENHFALVEDAPHSVLIAGGIGITPLFCMAQRLQAIGRSWELHYRCSRRDSAALLEELGRPGFRERVRLSFSEDAGTPRLDIAAVVAAAPQGTHFYCCGPNAMIESFEQACAAIPAECVHKEHFSAIEAPATDGGYTVRLARSGRVLPVVAGNTILSTLSAHGVKTRSSCEQGVCGECEVQVLAGTPDHRDMVLSPEERASGRTMMICCSGSLTPELTLDL
ncbi:PDR/VanB family oxidoreductase, partial [Bradyrhizobium yuanmingense]|uniref:PDR/VanB family oxidoreductase n=1 Tax=Bradyrhizobium yuanmingense TaxID=108015 RepID=UPI0005631DCF